MRDRLASTAVLIWAGLALALVCVDGASARSEVWESCGSASVVSYAGTHYEADPLEAKEADCSTAVSVVQSFYSQEIGSSGATVAAGLGCAYEGFGAAVLCQSFSGSGYDGPVGVRWQEHLSTADEDRIAGCRSFTVFRGHSRSVGSYEYRATSVRRSALIRCGLARKLLKGAYGRGPLKVVRIVRPATGRPTYWLRGGWRCGNGAGGAACWNARRQRFNAIPLEGLSHGLAVTADVG